MDCLVAKPDAVFSFNMPLLLPGVTQGATTILISRNLRPVHDSSGRIAACARAKKVAHLDNGDMSVDHLIDLTT